MKNKAAMTVLGVATLLALGATHSVFANDCNPCATPKPAPKPVIKTGCNPCTITPPPPVAKNDCNPCAAPPPAPVVVKPTCNPCVVPPPPPKPVAVCTTCATTVTNVTYHPVKSGQFHEQLVPKDAAGNPLACLDVSGSSVKVGVDWKTSTNDVFTWGTHTTKYNTATVTEQRYQ